MLCKVEMIFMNLVMTCNDEPSVSAAKYLMYRKLLRSTIAFILEVRGGNIVTCTQKITKFHGR